MNRKAILSTVAVFSLLALGSAQNKANRPSPPAQASTTINGKSVTIDYSRPSAKGRKVFGGIVPWGQVWRTGANEATTLKTATDLNINGTKVPAGTYTLFTLPAESGWKLIVSKETGQWGTDYKPANDLARIDVKSEKTKAPVEQFTMRFEGSNLIMEWENTRVWADFNAKK